MQQAALLCWLAERALKDNSMPAFELCKHLSASMSWADSDDAKELIRWALETGRERMAARLMRECGCPKPAGVLLVQI